MRSVRLLSVLVATALVVLVAFAGVPAEQSAANVDPYAPTPTPTPSNGGSNNGGSVGSGGFAIGLALMQKGSTTRSVKASVTLNSAGTVKLRAFKGGKKVGKRTVTLRDAATRKTRVRLDARKLGGRLPVEVTVRASATNVSGEKARTKASLELVK